MRVALQKAEHIIREGAGLRSADEVGREAEAKAIAEVRAKGVPSSRAQRDLDAQKAGDEAYQKAVENLRERQATLVEKLLDFIDSAGLSLPPVSQVIAAVIRNWDTTFPFLRSLVERKAANSRTVLREILHVLRNPR